MNHDGCYKENPTLEVSGFGGALNGKTHQLLANGFSFFYIRMFQPSTFIPGFLGP